MIELENAIEILKKNSKKIFDVEEKNLLECVGKICAENYFAKFDNPPFNRSPLDGFTFFSKDTLGATEKNPKKFKIVGEECAGDFFCGEIKNFECVRIMTGAAIPKNCDCVIRQEDVKIEGENIFVPYELKNFENFCFAGEDIKKNSLLIEKNQKISAAHIAILASQGISKIKIFREKKIAVASTGDELLNPDEKISEGKIYNSNLFLLAARLIELGFKPKILGNLPDNAEIAAQKISEEHFDFLITTGGVSVGKKDIMHDVVKILGEKLFWRINIKPGAPVIGWKTDNFLGIALSGNPFAAFATFELICRPILQNFSLKKIPAILQNNFPKKSFCRRFIRGKFFDGKIYLPENHQSGNLFSAIDCNCLVDIPENSTELKIGDKVEVILL